MYEIILIPSKDHDNEYATPCFFYFDTMGEAMSFLEIVIIHGDDIQATISHEEME